MRGARRQTVAGDELSKAWIFLPGVVRPGTCRHKAGIWGGGKRRCRTEFALGLGKPPTNEVCTGGSEIDQPLPNMSVSIYILDQKAVTEESTSSNHGKRFRTAWRFTRIYVNHLSLVFFSEKWLLER